MPENLLDTLDYYGLLQVSPTASSDEVRAAFHRFAAKYHPDRFMGEGSSIEKVERAAAIYRRGAEAYKVLMDGARRKQYDQGLAQGHLRYDASLAQSSSSMAPTGFPLKVKSPLARPFALKAEQLYKSGDFGNAKVNLKLALQKEGTNAQLEELLRTLEERLSKPA